MLNYSNVITEEKSYTGLQMKEYRPVMKLIIRGKKREFLSGIGKSLNLLLPTEANTSSRSDKLTALWLSPDEWLIYSNEISDANNNEYESKIEVLNFKIRCRKVWVCRCSPSLCLGFRKFGFSTVPLRRALVSVLSLVHPSSLCLGLTNKG